MALNTALKTKRRRESSKLLLVGESIKFERDPYEESPRDRAEIERLYNCIDRLNTENKAIILLWLDDKLGNEIADIKEEYVKGMNFTFVRTNEEVLDLAHEK